MALEYTNRKGQRYYVLQGRTKSGKPKYFCARKPGATPVDGLPDDFEIFEHPITALVTVRKVKPSRLLPFELDFLKEQIRNLSEVEHFIIDRSGDSFTIYICDINSDDVNRLLSRLIGPMGCHAESSRQWMIENAKYSPAFRFTLIDENERLFRTERWCYRGRIDDWITLTSRDRPLDELTNEFLPHLGEESYFDLI